MIIPVILSGGSGTRLWPVSREAFPKPFMKLLDGETLIQKTFLRALNLDDVSEIITITNREYYFQSKDEYGKVIPSHQAPVFSFILEPFARNTAAAIAMAAFKACQNNDNDAILLVLPADHLIENQSEFKIAFKAACELASQNKLVTFGIVPTEPETGFGYIECGENLATENSYAVKRFAEKPNEITAAAYLKAGHFLWNSGMFCFKASLVLKQFQLHDPAFYQAIKQCWETSLQQPGITNSVIELEATSFGKLTDISFDYAIMEKSTDIAVVKGQFDWSDIGSWNAFSKLQPADVNGNVVVGETLLVDSNNTFVRSDHRLVACLGVNDLMVIDTPDAVLVMHRDQAQKVRSIVQQLKGIAHASYKEHRTVFRPWGSYTILEEGPCYKIKRIVVSSRASLSLQMHHHRSEHWVVISGIAKVTNGQQNILLNPNESTYIPAGNQHRLENPGLIDLVIIEVQTGSYLGEDDIIRFEDIYGRTASLTAAHTSEIS